MSSTITALPVRIDTHGPRYTSYPTADRFTPAFGATDLRQALATRRPGPLSVYVHIPFCESVCYYCACNKVVTKHHDRAKPYLDALYREIALYREAFGGPQPVAQLHFGGGTPTFLSDTALAEVMATLTAAFPLAPGAEVSIEVDPRTADADRLAHLRQLGFNRLSFGVQDFDPAVQRAIHREQSFLSVAALIHAARTLGFVSTNVDLIHGLPKQTPASFARTLDEVTALRPDRIALYAYAHLPDRFKAQRRIDIVDLPDAAQRRAMVEEANRVFTAQGYELIGMDHYALSGDSLAVAKREGRLHRNFQGYSTHADCDLVGLGVSSIGRIGDTYAQNAKTIPEYEAALARAEFPVERGIALDADDVARREAIMAIMCRGRLDIPGFEARHGGRFGERFATELAELGPLAGMGLVRLQPDAIVVTPAGWHVVRGIAMVFDAHLRAAKAPGRYARIA